MKIKEIIKLLNAEILVGEGQEEYEIKGAFASDMMSDVLAFVSDQSMLVTGLVNPQVVRTCEMMDINCILFVRGKRPDTMVLELAKSKDMIIMATQEKMYPSCGLLYSNGLGRVDS